MDNNRKILHAGCGKTKIPGAIGLDFIKIPGFVDVIYDLNEFPYPFRNNLFDEIHLYHVLEHLDNPLRTIEEMHRILKNGGILYMRVPHFSSMAAFSDITHKRPFGYSSFDIFEDTNPSHYYTKVNFKIVKKEINYLVHCPNSGIHNKNIYKNISSFVLRPIALTLTFFISLNPMLFERFWCYFIGGATEVKVELKKSI